MNELGPGSHLPPVRDHYRLVTSMSGVGSAIVMCRTYDAGAADRAAALYAKTVLDMVEPRVNVAIRPSPQRGLSDVARLRPIPAGPNGKQVVTRRRPKNVQAKHIDDVRILGVVRRLCWERTRKLDITGSRWLPTTTWNVAKALAPLPEKVIAAKLRQLKKRGLLDGCPCGCRGDWELTGKGKQQWAELAGIRTAHINMAERATVKVACVECGWSNDGRLVLVDRYLTDYPPIPRGNGHGFLEVYRDVAGDPDDRNPKCDNCGLDLEPDSVRE